MRPDAEMPVFDKEINVRGAVVDQPVLPEGTIHYGITADRHPGGMNQFASPSPPKIVRPGDLVSELLAGELEYAPQRSLPQGPFDARPYLFIAGLVDQRAGCGSDDAEPDVVNEQLSFLTLALCGGVGT